jgi:integrase
MARPKKGARLYLRAGLVDARTGTRLAPTYYIRDGQKSISTGCGPDRLGEAEAQLAAYVARKQEPIVLSQTGATDPAHVTIAEVIGLYAREKAPHAADPKSVAARLAVLLEFWGDKAVADIRRSTCLAYVAHRQNQPVRAYKDAARAPRVTAAGARRELEDLSSAVSWWHAEHPLSRVPVFTFPAKPSGSPREALSRSQAAALLWAAMGWRKDEQGRWKRLSKSAVANRRHLRRFIILGLYSGSRPGVLPKLRWEMADHSAWVDLERGWIFRRGSGEVDHPNKSRPAFRVPKRLLAHLRRWRAMDEHLSLELKAQGRAPITTVLHHGGEPLQGRIRKGYASVVADAGLDPRISPHWHRHTCATWLMEKNVEPTRAGQYLGMSQRTLERYYAHHRPDHQSDIDRALSRRL